MKEFWFLHICISLSLLIYACIYIYKLRRQLTFWIQYISSSHKVKMLAYFLLFLPPWVETKIHLRPKQVMLSFGWKGIMWSISIPEGPLTVDWWLFLLSIFYQLFVTSIYSAEIDCMPFKVLFKKGFFFQYTDSITSLVNRRKRISPWTIHLKLYFQSKK